MSGRVGEGGARIGEGGGRGEIGREELGGGGRDKQGVASITNDLLRGAETPLHQGKGSLVLKSLLRSNTKSEIENVVKMLVKKDKEIM